MKIENTFTATIYVSAKEHYDGITHTYQETEQICQKYLDKIYQYKQHLGLAITPTNFLYRNGGENGFIIGLINYPRFPSSDEEITRKAIEIAKMFLNKFSQYRISVVTSNCTYLIDKSDIKAK